MRNIFKSKRIIFLLYTLVYSVVLFVLYILDLYTYGFYTAILASLVLFALAYQFIFKPYGKFKFIYKKLVYYSLLLFPLTQILYFYSALTDTTKFAFIIASALLIYINFLALNIYFVSERKMLAIPLLQSAKLVISIVVISVAFFGSTVIYKYGQFFNNGLLLSGLQILIFYLFNFLLLFSSEWFHFNEEIEAGKESKLKGQLASLRIFASIVITQFAVALMFFPFEDMGRGLILASLAYVSLNLFQAFISRNVNRKFILESSFILVFAYLLAYYL